ncbi:MAG TPA: hypothetical protein VGV35_21265 [Bryobacteraceae bacterium]|nr:hypothetical protein [Bryobacteraceae bacterium]
MRRRVLWCALLWTSLAFTAPEQFDLKVHTNRTALWVGDRLEYTVRVEYPATVEFVTDHLKKEEMNLPPFELLEVRSAIGMLPQSRKFLEVRLLLTIYDISHAEATVPSFNLFYFRQGQAQNNDDSPAEVLTVPPLTVGLRSTVVDPAGKIRDSKEVLPIPTSRWMLPEILGLLGLAIVAVSVAWLAVAQIRSGFWKTKMAERTRKKSLSESLQEIREAPAESPEELDSFYKKASEILRAIAAETPDNGSGLSDILRQCDVIRYSPDGLEQGRRERPEFLRKLEDLTRRH